MPIPCPERFEREMGCSEVEWLRWLPEAIGAHEWSLQGRSACVEFDQACAGPQAYAIAAAALLKPRLELSWQPLPPRSIALLTLPRLQVSFAFHGLDEAGRQHFMRRFDLYLQRGGG